MVSRPGRPRRALRPGRRRFRGHHRAGHAWYVGRERKAVRALAWCTLSRRSWYIVSSSMSCSVCRRLRRSPFTGSRCSASGRGGQSARGATRTAAGRLAAAVNAGQRACCELAVVALAAAHVAVVQQLGGVSPCSAQEHRRGLAARRRSCVVGRSRRTVVSQAHEVPPRLVGGEVEFGVLTVRHAVHHVPVRRLHLHSRGRALVPCCGRQPAALGLALPWRARASRSNIAFCAPSPNPPPRLSK